MKQPTGQGKNLLSSSTDIAGQVAAAIQESVGDRNYQHWFHKRSRCQVVDEALVVYVANPFISNWMMKRFRSQLNTAAATLLGPSGRFRIEVDGSLRVESADIEKSDESDSTDHSPVAVIESQSSGSGEPQPLAVRSVSRRRFRSFASFVAGPCNELALMASRQVVDAPGERFNPLYIHGGTGLGKSHLLESIYTDIRRKSPQLNVMYLSSEMFTNYFTQALESRTVPSFRQKFRSVDVLLIDNIEFLDNKKATQEEFLHTIVQVTDHGGQLVVTGDRHPRLLTRHREELTTRFMSGLVCRIEQPAEDTRTQLVQALALPMQSDFTQEALNYVARKCRKNVREIQGALNCLHSHFVLTRAKITVSRARDILGDLERECRRLVRISDVERVVCDAFGLSVKELRSKSRRRAVACPRSLAMYMARKLTKSAYREIGVYFGGRDHSTVVAAERRVHEWLQSEKSVDLPNSCRGATVGEIIAELEERLLSMAC